MITTKDQNKLDDFKRSYILKKSNEMAQNYEFIKGFTLKKMSEYVNLLSIFWKNNQTIIDEIIKSKKNNSFFKNLGFISRIPNLIKVYKSEIEIDYIFLRENFFKIEKAEKITELQNNLKKMEQKFKPVANINDSSFNISDLYEFGEVILNFLTSENVRKKICQHLLESEAKKNKFDKELNEWITQEQISTTFWKNSNLELHNNI